MRPTTRTETSTPHRRTAQQKPRPSKFSTLMTNIHFSSLSSSYFSITFAKLYQLHWKIHKQTKTTTKTNPGASLWSLIGSMLQAVSQKKLGCCCLTLHLKTYTKITTVGVNLSVVSVTGSDLLALGLTYTLPRAVQPDELSCGHCLVASS